MSSELKSPPPENPPAFSWARAWLVAPAPDRRARAILIVLGSLTALGWLDYAAGFWVSLQLFYLIPVLLSVAWLGWRFGAVIAVLSVATRLAGDIAAGVFQHMDPAAVFWNRLVEACVSLVIVWVFHSLISLQRELEERVRQRTTSLEHAVGVRHELQKQLFEAAQSERSAIGHDLHDGLGQHLTATSIAANVLAVRLAAAAHPDAERARKVVDLVQDGIAKTRQIARGLLLSTIEPAELPAELEELAATVRQEHGVDCQFTLLGNVGPISVATASHLFYIAQEATRNAVRHARPTRIYLHLAVTGRDLVLSVTDDGAGFPPPATGSPGMGLRIMRHRSDLIGGKLELGTALPHGTCVHCRVPLTPALPS